MEKQIIINGDDFGLRDEVNEAIVKAHTEGVLTSASIMVNMPAAEKAVKLAKDLPELGIGVHLNLSKGKATSDNPVVKNLLERNLIHISGRSETIGRALLYSTTPEFLQYFGVYDISALPKPREIEELLGSGQEELPFSSDDLDGKIVENISTLDESDLVDDVVE